MEKGQVKLMIKKFKALYPNRNGPGDWGRYYVVDKIIFTPGEEFKTEAELALYIYKKFGVGRFNAIAWMRGYEGFFSYFIGNIYENGWLREKDRNKELERIKSELSKASTPEDRDVLAEELDFEREIIEDEKKEKNRKLRGPVGLIRYSVGQMHSFDELPPTKREKPLSNNKFDDNSNENYVEGGNY